MQTSVEKSGKTIGRLASGTCRFAHYKEIISVKGSETKLNVVSK